MLKDNQINQLQIALLPDERLSENFTNVIHFFNWNIKTIWSNEIDEDDKTIPYSMLNNMVIPKIGGKVRFD